MAQVLRTPSANQWMRTFVSREADVAHFGERLDSVEDLRLFHLEAVRVFERAPVQFLAARGVDVRFAGGGRGDGKGFHRA